MGIAATGFDVTGCLEAAAGLEADVIQLITALTEAQFHAPPRSGGWSVGYCIEHLVLSGQAFLPRWDAALEEAEACHSDAEFAYGWWRRGILRCESDPTRLKRKTPDRFIPYSRHSIGETVGRFVNMHKELSRRVTAARRVDARRTRVQSPFVPWVWYALGFSFDLALAHERRHLSQAWQVRRLLTGV